MCTFPRSLGNLSMGPPIAAFRTMRRTDVWMPEEWPDDNRTLTFVPGDADREFGCVGRAENLARFLAQDGVERNDVEGLVAERAPPAPARSPDRRCTGCTGLSCDPAASSPAPVTPRRWRSVRHLAAGGCG